MSPPPTRSNTLAALSEEVLKRTRLMPRLGNPGVELSAQSAVELREASGSEGAHLNVSMIGRTAFPTVLCFQTLDFTNARMVSTS
jgi:hypothetical protein